MALKDYNDKQLEQIAYFVIAILCFFGLVGLAVYDLTRPENVSPIVYGGLIGAILRVAIKGFDIATYVGGNKDKESKK